MKKKILLAGAALGIASFGVQNVHGETKIPEKPGYHIDFQDDFDGPALDKTKWTDSYLSHWADNKEDAKANYSIEDGVLKEYIDINQKPWAPTLDKDNYGYGTNGVKSSAIQSFNKNWIHNFSGSQKLMSPIQ